MRNYRYLIRLTIGISLLLAKSVEAKVELSEYQSFLDPLTWVGGLSLLLLLTALLLRLQVKSRTGELRASNQHLKREIFERKFVQQELQKAKEQAEQATFAKNEFLTKISQDIRGPMNGIIGMTELALTTPLTPPQEEHLQTVKKSAYSLLNLINEILDFSKIEAGKVELESIPFNLRDCLDQALKNLLITAEANGLRMVYRIDENVPEMLVGDPTRVRQIVVNLLNRAVQVTSEGEIRLAIHRQPTFEDEICLGFTVSDTGVGLATDAVSAGPGNEMTDLSLATTLQLVRLMGGETEICSPSREKNGRLQGVGDAGTSFHFTLRFNPQPQASDSSFVASSQNLKGTRVLIVDDNPTDQQALTDMLSLWEMKSTAVKNAIEALLSLESAHNAGIPFDLVILDANLPEIDGFDLAKEIQQSGYCAQVKIILLTSAAMRGDGQRCRDIGVHAYLPKPVDQTDLLHTLMAVMTRESTGDLKGALVTRHWLKENRKPLRILLAEGNPMNRKFVVRLLEKWNHQVTVADNGLKAVEAAENEVFDLILMDIQLPGMDGLEATHAIRAYQERHGINSRIIAMTSSLGSDGSDKLRDTGLDGYLSKPIRVDELYNIIRTAALAANKHDYVILVS